MDNHSANFVMDREYNLHIEVESDEDKEWLYQEFNLYPDPCWKFKMWDKPIWQFLVYRDYKFCTDPYVPYGKWKEVTLDELQTACLLHPEWYVILNGWIVQNGTNKYGARGRYEEKDWVEAENIPADECGKMRDDFIFVEEELHREKRMKLK